jgi:hypothetical protein
MNDLVIFFAAVGLWAVVLLVVFLVRWRGDSRQADLMYAHERLKQAVVERAFAEEVLRNIGDIYPDELVEAVEFVDRDALAKKIDEYEDNYLDSWAKVREKIWGNNPEVIMKERGALYTYFHNWLWTLSCDDLIEEYADYLYENVLPADEQES